LEQGDVMETGLRGAFVIGWAQTRIDGRPAATTDDIRPGAVWGWTGDFVRVDGPATILPLGEAQGMTDLRRRAAQQVQKMLGPLDTVGPALTNEKTASGPTENGAFTVTDGRRTWTATLIDAGAGRWPLLLFLGDIPPQGCEMWIVAHRHGPTVRPWAADLSGGVICFTPGTMILTAAGPRPVEGLVAGDLVQTKDNGCQPILWTGRRRLSGARLFAMPHLAPIRFRAGAIDKSVPDDGLLLSPDHRIVLRGVRARALFNCDEVLVAARDLVNDGSIRAQRGLREVTYIHLLLPAHEIVFANSVETDSFHPASVALSTIEDSQRTELFRLLPFLEADPQSYGGFARRMLSQSEAAILRADAA
jgi:hypothetical protein